MTITSTQPVPDTLVSALLAPTRLGALHLPNRLVMAPMTRNRADAQGVPGPLMAAYYAQRASAGLIIAEAATPNTVGQTYPSIPAIHRPEHVAGWRAVTGAVRAAGVRLLAAGADAISLGRSFLANPDLVHRLRVGAPINQVRETGLMYTGGKDGYTDYPALQSHPAT